MSMNRLIFRVQEGDRANLVGASLKDSIAYTDICKKKETGDI